MLLWNSTQNIWHLHWKMRFLYNFDILRTLEFERLYAFFTLYPRIFGVKIHNLSYHNEIDICVLLHSDVCWYIDICHTYCWANYDWFCKGCILFFFPEWLTVSINKIMQSSCCSPCYNDWLLLGATLVKLHKIWPIAGITLRPRQIIFAGDFFKSIFLYGNCCVWIKFHWTVFLLVQWTII